MKLLLIRANHAPSERNSPSPKYHGHTGAYWNTKPEVTPATVAPSVATIAASDGCSSVDARYPTP